MSHAPSDEGLVPRRAQRPTDPKMSHAPSDPGGRYFLTFPGLCPK